MEHSKKYYKIIHETKKQKIIIEGPLASQELKKYAFHNDLTAFRPPQKQFEALLSIADFPEGRIFVARTEDTIIGYVTYLHPDPLERWSTFKMEELIELGAVEVIPEYRGEHVASKLLEIGIMDEFVENYIIISTEYYWHWDLDSSGLSIWEYRKMMEKMMAKGGLYPSPTDDPEIISHPANCLMVRIGKNVSEESIKRFDVLRFLTKNQMQSMKEV